MEALKEHAAEVFGNPVPATKLKSWSVSHIIG
jgi:hypothetical protein